MTNPKLLKVYTTRTCAYCPKVKGFLDYQNMPYEIIEVDDDPVTRQFLVEKTGLLTVPVTSDGVRYVSGFQPMQLMEFKYA